MTVVFDCNLARRTTSINYDIILSFDFKFRYTHTSNERHVVPRGEIAIPTRREILAGHTVFYWRRWEWPPHNIVGAP